MAPLYKWAHTLQTMLSTDDARDDCEVGPRNRTHAGDEDWLPEADGQSFGEWIGQGCAWCMINHSDIPLFLLSFVVLYLSINRCCYCVMVVAIVSALMCMRFPLLNATLWSSLIVLYLHKDWKLSFGDVKVSWNRAA